MRGRGARKGGGGDRQAAKVDKVKEEIGWLKLLLVLVFTVAAAVAGWMWENLSWPSMTRSLEPWKGLRLFAGKLGLWEWLALAVEMFLLLLMLKLGVDIRARINRLGEIDEHRNR